MCEYFVTSDTEVTVFTNVIVGCLLGVLAWCYDLEVFNRVNQLFYTGVAVELLARFVDSLSLCRWYQVDVLTTYLLVWQWITLLWKWMWRQLPAPTLLMEQGSICVFTAFTASSVHHLLVRYSPTAVNFGCLWFLSVIDM
jgi:hypothetical protein